MGNMSIRVTKAELDSHGQNSVELPSGGYLAWLGVFHELHCVVSMTAQEAASFSGHQSATDYYGYRKCFVNGATESITIPT